MGRYEKTKLDYHSLYNETKYRFIEIELNAAAQALTPFYNNRYEHALRQIIITLVPDDLDLCSELIGTFINSYRFRNPTKEELTQYLRYTNIGVHQIAPIVDLAPNTVTKYKTKIPDFTPVFIEWFKYPDTRKRWYELKKSINIFKAPAIHTINPCF